MDAQDGFYSIIDYAVDGERTQQELIEAFAEIQRRWVSFYKGYCGATLFASIDGRRVYNIVKWASRNDFEDFELNSDTAGRIAAIEAAVSGVSGAAVPQMTGPPRFTVTCVVHPSANPPPKEHHATDPY
ncbi:MAG: hypothetical protein K0R68_1476 [Mycobacterium sp.]|jgi:C-6 monooxygenase|nr:hypothetical protein [Mycobacterium sp.]